jgi:hypothetical protein
MSDILEKRVEYKTKLFHQIERTDDERLAKRFYQFIQKVREEESPVTVAVRSEAWVLASWLLESWVRIPLKAWMFVPCLSVLCCPV